MFYSSDCTGVFFRQVNFSLQIVNDLRIWAAGMRLQTFSPAERCLDKPSAGA
jgi:hypothetical protein